MNEKIIDVLIDLAQLDIDAVAAYEQALEKIDDNEIYENINTFKNDHIRHVDELSHLIRKLGGTPPEMTKDLKGYLIEGMTFLRSVTGTKGALKAMESNEKITNNNYKKAIENNPGLPEDIEAILQNNYNDEKRHLEYIEMILKKFEDI